MNEKYEKQIYKAPWKDIKEHAARDGVVIVAPEIPLAHAAQAVVENHVETVNEWINTGKFIKPTADELNEWEKDLEKQFLLFIAQPYVLIQEVTLQ